jgi:predicted nucleic acid-binding Zn ribbon protein
MRTVVKRAARMVDSRSTECVEEVDLVDAKQPTVGSVHLLRYSATPLLHHSSLAICYWLSNMRASRLPSEPQSVVSELVMATYIYETVPDSAESPTRRFEVRQSMLDAPLTRDPETGQPVRRVISGGFGLMTGSKNVPSSGSSSSSCGSGHCGCC